MKTLSLILLETAENIKHALDIETLATKRGGYFLLTFSNSYANMPLYESAFTKKPELVFFCESLFRKRLIGGVYGIPGTGEMNVVDFYRA